jgi:hypothetical protein
MEDSMFDDALTHCSQYLQDETHFKHRVRNNESLQTEISVTTPFFHNIGRALAGNCILNLEEIPECPDERINDDDWQSIYKYWLSSEFQVRNM